MVLILDIPATRYTILSKIRQLVSSTSSISGDDNRKLWLFESFA